MTNSKKQHKNTETETIPSRRRFLQKLWMGLGILALVEFIGVGIAFLRPGKPTAKEGDLGSIIEAGVVDEFEPGSVTAFIRGQFYLLDRKMVDFSLFPEDARILVVRCHGILKRNNLSVRAIHLFLTSRERSSVLRHQGPLIFTW